MDAQNLTRKAKPAPKLPITERLLLSPREQAALLGVSIRALYLLDSKLPPVVMVGPKSPRRRRADLEAFVAGMQPSDDARVEPDQLRNARAKRKGAGTPSVVVTQGTQAPGAGSEAQRGDGILPSPSNPAEVAS